MHIQHLTLYTQNLPALIPFYRDILGLPCQQTDFESADFQVGASRLTFKTGDSAGGYHFALNIPPTQLPTAKTWLAAQIPLMTDAGGADQFHSDRWNADMIYFVDPDGNILELIARQTLTTAETEFKLLNISEFGIPAADVLETLTHLQGQMWLSSYQGTFNDTFTPLGDENGLLIVVKLGRIWFPTAATPSKQLPFEVNILDGANQPFTISAPPYPVQVQQG